MPRSEPEIIPPDRDDEGRPDAQWFRHFVDERGTHRIHVGKVGPLGVVLGSLLVAAVAATVLVVLLSVLLIWIPVVGLIVATLIITGWLRGYFKRAQ